MGFDQDFVNTGLVLGLGFSTPIEEIKPDLNHHHRKIHQPSLTLSLSGDAGKNVDSDYLNRPDHSAAASSFSNISVKRERDIGGSEEAEIERVSSRISDEDDDGSNGRKKLRLSKDQSALLEESFKRHSTLNPKQKQELARELKLRPRQVEVWFQNRRARTKLKQTEVDYEFLKKCCETLTGENQRLQKELQELKALKLSQPLYMKFPAATLTMCPSCERIVHGSSTGASAGAGSGATSSAYNLMASGKPHFYYSHFSNEPTAC